MLNRVLLFLAFCFAVFAICFLMYKNHEISVRQESIEKQIISSRELTDSILRSSSRFASKEDIESLAKSHDLDLKSIQKDLDRLGGQLTAINVYVTSSKGKKQSDVASDSTFDNTNPVKKPTVECNGKTIDCPNPDTYGYLHSGQKINLNEDFNSTSVPFGSVEFSAWKEKPWNTEIYQRDYVSNTVIGMDEDDRIYSYNKTYILVGGKKYELNITNSTLQQKYPDPSFKFWNPHLYMGYDVGFNATALSWATGPSINLQVMSYGRYNKNPEFSILQVGVGVDFEKKVLTGVLSPFSYNIGNKIPFMNNLYIGPSLFVGTNQDVMLMGGVRVGL